MFVYELALELDEKSGDLVALGTAHGIEGLGPSSQLTREQVASMRAAVYARRTGTVAPAAPGDSDAAVWAPPGEPGAAPPPPPPPPPGMPQFEPATSPIFGDAPPPSPGEAMVPGIPDPGERRGGVVQKAVIGGAVVAVLALFGYMTLNSGPDEEKKARIEAANKAAESRPPTTFGTVPSTTVAQQPAGDAVDPAPATTLPNDTTYKDRFKFCEGMRGAIAYEWRIGAGEIERDWLAVQAAARDGQAEWERDIATALEGASPALRPDVQRYADWMRSIRERIANGKSEQDLMTVIDDLRDPQFRYSINRINQSIQRSCLED